MKLQYITIMVQDVEKSVAFYQQLAGLHEMRRIPLNNGEIVFLGNAAGETMLEFIQMEGVPTVAVRGMIMSFQAGSALEELRERAAALGYAPSDIIRGAKPNHFTVPDPDGMLVEFSV